MSKISLLAGTSVPENLLLDELKLVDSYYGCQPDAQMTSQRVSFGTSGHRGTSFHTSFNEWHVLAISQSISEYRKIHGINGPLFLGVDSHAISRTAANSALEVLVANGVQVRIAQGNEFTPTPAISHAILVHNRSHASNLADGIVMSPSHNPPEDGGYKYNPPNGGPADTKTTAWIQNRANQLIEQKLQGVKRIALEEALKSENCKYFDFLNSYVRDLEQVIDIACLRDSKIKMGVDPLGGAGVNYWPAIAEYYKLDLTVVNKVVDSTFRFMTLDWDGRIRMDPSSSFAMQSLVGLKDKFDIAFACDTDHDRHGIVAPSVGLVPPNHYLACAVFYLFNHRFKWHPNAAVGKTLVSSGMIDKVAQSLGRSLYEVPVGFKWFVDGLLDGSLGFTGEESAGASFLRIDGSVWTTDKDGIIAGLLSAEMTAKLESDPGRIYAELERQFGSFVYDRIDASASAQQKKALSALAPDQVCASELAGERIQSKLSHAPGNNAPIGGLKVATESAWFAARPSGTEDIYKIYAESSKGIEHLKQVMKEAQEIVDSTLASAAA